MNLIVYADFTRPDCYLASRRVDVLRAAGIAVDWRAVEHEPRLSVIARPLSAGEQDRRSGRFAELVDLLLPGEQLPWAMPTAMPRTEAAVTAYAEAFGAGVADEVRRLLVELYWLRDADIGSPAVLRTPLVGPILRGNSTSVPLRESGYAVSVDGGPITTAAHRRIRAWRAEWHQLGSPSLPVAQSGTAVLSGLDALRHLGETIVDAGAPVRPELDDPRRYPPVTDRPPATWVSQTGGRWRTTYRLPAARWPVYWS